MAVTGALKENERASTVIFFSFNFFLSCLQMYFKFMHFTRCSKDLLFFPQTRANGPRIAERVSKWVVVSPTRKLKANGKSYTSSNFLMKMREMFRDKCNKSYS